MSITDFIRPELMVLIPVMYFIGIAVKRSPVRDYLIPFILGGTSIIFATIYVLATAQLAGWQDVLMAVFVAATQGVLTAGASVYVNQLIKQGKSGAAAAEIIKNFIPPAADPLLTMALVKKGNKVRAGQVHTKNKIIIHDTGNPKKDANALAHASYLHNMAAMNTDYISWHYTVDADRIIQHIPDNEIAWHAGDGEKENGGNMSGIGIEMCINDLSRFEDVLRNTAWLVGKLMAVYGWGIDAVKQHYDCSGKDCPHEVRKITGKWENFLALCKTEYNKQMAPAAYEQYHRVQTGAWTYQALAEAYAAMLRKIKIDGELVRAVVRHYDGYYRVQVGAWTYESLAKSFANKLHQCKIDGKNIETTIKYY